MAGILSKLSAIIISLYRELTLHRIPEKKLTLPADIAQEIMFERNFEVINVVTYGCQIYRPI